MTTSRRLATGLAVALIAMTAACALADATSDARKQIQGLYDQESAAFMKKDTKAMLAHYSPDFTFTDSKGMVHKFKDLQGMLSLVLPMLNDIRDKTVITKFTLNGNKAVAVVTESTESMLQNPQTGKAGKL